MATTKDNTQTKFCSSGEALGFIAANLVSHNGHNTHSIGIPEFVNKEKVTNALRAINILNDAMHRDSLYKMARTGLKHGKIHTTGKRFDLEAPKNKEIVDNSIITLLDSGMLEPASKYVIFFDLTRDRVLDMIKVVNGNVSTNKEITERKSA